MIDVHLDFETRSLVNIKASGAWVYSKHPTTSILCAAFKYKDHKTQLVMDAHGFVDDWRDRLKALAENPSVIWVAHNALFEQCIWKNIMVDTHGLPEIPPERWRCTAAKAAYFSLPRDLEGVGMALNLETQKDLDGGKIMKILSAPRRGKFGGDVVFYEYDDRPDDFEKLYAYCMTDVDTEFAVDHALPSLNTMERQVWVLDQKINLRGVTLDLAAVHQVLEFISRTQTELLDEFQSITEGQVETPGQVAKFLKWLSENGCDLSNLQAATVAKRLQGGWLDDLKVSRALEIRQALSKISTGKYQAMLDRVDPDDGRLRDILLYCAAITHRWGGRGVQPQNFPRGVVNSNVAIDHMMTGDFKWFSDLYPDQMAAYSSSIRGMITASRGCELYAGDFSSIEAMTLPWLAGQEDTLNVFREGRDPYCEEAVEIFRRKVVKSDKYERSVGKVSVLALGYQGGIGAFGTMCRGYGVDIVPAYDILWPDANEDEKRKARSAYNRYLGRQEKAEDPDPLDRASGYAADVIKQRWRAKNALVTQYWNDVERAAIQAVLTGEKQTIDGGRPPVTFGMMGEHLLCQLPSGNCIVYPFAKITSIETDWGEKKYALTYKSQDSTTFQFFRTHTYGGKLVENITQSVARDLLAASLLRLDEAGYPIVLHVHDEIVADVPKGFGSLDEFKELMAVVPPWANGLPIKVDAWKGHRYRK